MNATQIFEGMIEAVKAAGAMTYSASLRDSDDFARVWFTDDHLDKVKRAKKIAGEWLLANADGRRTCHDKGGARAPRKIWRTSLDEFRTGVKFSKREDDGELRGFASKY